MPRNKMYMGRMRILALMAMSHVRHVAISPVFRDILSTRATTASLSNNHPPLRNAHDRFRHLVASLARDARLHRRAVPSMRSIRLEAGVSPSTAPGHPPGRLQPHPHSPPVVGMVMRLCLNQSCDKAKVETMRTCVARAGMAMDRAKFKAKTKAARPKTVFALDFDGVLCDSVGESSLSAWRAAEELWPEQFRHETAIEEKERVMEAMRVVRPVVETGYENVLLVRILLEGLAEPEEVLQDWLPMRNKWMEAWGLERNAMVEQFANCRDTWMKEDLEGWLAPNRFYEGTPEALACALNKGEVYIVTTKQERYTAQLLGDMAKTPVPHERILSTTLSGLPKTTVLAELQEKHNNEDTRMVFVEDKIATLEKVCATPGLEQWELFLVNWGYNTKEERMRAEENPRIKLLGLTEFQSLVEA